MVPSYEPVASRLGGQKAMQRMSSWWPLSRRGTSNARPAAVVLLPGCLDTLSGSGCSTSSRDQPTDAKYWKAPWLMCSTPVSSRVASSSLSAARAAAVALAAAAKAAEVAEAVWAALSAARRAGGLAAREVPQAHDPIGRAGEQPAARAVEAHRRQLGLAVLETEEGRACLDVPHADEARLVTRDDEEELRRVEHRDERAAVAVRCEHRGRELLLGRACAQLLPYHRPAGTSDQRCVLGVEGDGRDAEIRLRGRDGLHEVERGEVPGAHLAARAQRHQGLARLVDRQRDDGRLVPLEALDEVTRLE
eukprot:scaffold626_cov60-Phaeocystis_antarctica.AAC.11